MSAPLVTVGIPFYNAREGLADALRSVFAQSISDWEIIVLDDGSTDGSAEIALAVADPRVRVYVERENRKVAARRNDVIDLARGKYLAWLDSDDMMHPDRLEKECQFLEGNPSVDVVGTGEFILDEQGNVDRKRLLPTNAKIRPPAVPLIQPTVMGKMQWFRQNRYDPGLPRVQDMELWLRTSSYSNFANLQETLCFYAEHQSFALNKYRSVCQCRRIVIKRHCPTLIGSLHTQVEIVKTYLHFGAYAAACCFGAEDRLLRMRSSEPVTAAEKAEAQAVVDNIRRLELPSRMPR